MPPSLADRQAELDALTEGFLVPVFQRPGENGRMLNGLSPTDFRRVLAGYACPDCLAKYRTYLVTCPVCSYQRDIGADVEQPPDYWVQHLKDRADPNPVTAAKRGIDQVLQDIHDDPDVEQIPLSKLRNTRKKP